MPGMEGMESAPSMEMLMGFLGERILVNGHETPLLPIAPAPTAYACSTGQTPAFISWLE